jgi:zinc D-Ala-D-Ala carboxypeptidase
MLVYDPQARISNYFKMYEVGQSDTATRCHIDNLPTTPILTAAALLGFQVLDVIRDHYGIPFSPNSWYRGEKLERFINEQAYRTWCTRKGFTVNDESWAAYFALKSHPKGEAADIEIPGISNDDLYTWIDKNIPKFDQLIREFPKSNDPKSGWVHISFSATNNRRQLLTIT